MNDGEAKDEDWSRIRSERLRIPGRRRILFGLFLASLFPVLFVPLYTIFITAPAYNDFILKFAHRALVNIAGHLADEVGDLEHTPVRQSLKPQTIERLKHHRGIINLWKIKVFTTDGTRIFSTDPTDIGGHTSKYFFPEIVATGKSFSLIEKKIVHRDGKRRLLYLTETYVPIVREGRVIGIFEIYYDITKGREQLSGIILRQNVPLLFLAFLLLGVVVFSIYKANLFIKRREQLEARLRSMSITDELTGLYNRRGFFALAEKQLRITQRCGQDVFLLYLDLDNMKQINDSLGHLAGDQAMIDAGNILSSTFRQADVIGRLGGDEFVVMLSINDGGENEGSIVSRLRQNLREHNESAGRPFELEFSVGVIRCETDENCSIDLLLARADTLMYEEKKRRRG